MFSSLATFLLLLSIATASLSNWVPLNESPNLRSTSPNYNPLVINELKDFITLIPQATIDEVVAKHFIIDGDFRHAVKFLRSNDFKQLTQKAEQMPEVVEILNFLHLLVDDGDEANDDQLHANCAADEQIAGDGCEVIRRKLQLENTIDNLPVQIELLPDKSEDAVKRSLRSFTSFVEELLDHLPRDSYVRMIEEKRQRNADFANFYTSLRSPDFQQMADAAKKTANVAIIVETLKSNNIDPDGLEPIALRVISWGPSV